MGITVGAMLEEIQGLYRQHQQPCFLYLSSEVIKVILIHRTFVFIYDYLFNLYVSIIGTLFCRYLGQIHLVLST